VLKWVEEAVQASKVHLLSTDHLEHAVNTWKIPFDPSLKEVTVSLSGPSPVIEIRNPFGEMNQILIIKYEEQGRALFAHLIQLYE
jgi:hemicentin